MAVLKSWVSINSLVFFMVSFELVACNTVTESSDNSIDGIPIFNGTFNQSPLVRVRDMMQRIVEMALTNNPIVAIHKFIVRAFTDRFVGFEFNEFVKRMGTNISIVSSFRGFQKPAKLTEISKPEIGANKTDSVLKIAKPSTVVTGMNSTDATITTQDNTTEAESSLLWTQSPVTQPWKVVTPLISTAEATWMPITISSESGISEPNNFQTTVDTTMPSESTSEIEDVSPVIAQTTQGSWEKVVELTQVPTSASLVISQVINRSTVEPVSFTDKIVLPTAEASLTTSVPSMKELRSTETPQTESSRTTEPNEDFEDLEELSGTTKLEHTTTDYSKELKIKVTPTFVTHEENTDSPPHQTTTETPKKETMKLVCQMVKVLPTKNSTESEITVDPNGNSENLTSVTSNQNGQFLTSQATTIISTSHKKDSESFTETDIDFEDLEDESKETSIDDL